jgi:hypothetical protein
MTIWAPVVAALGASFLTGGFGFGGIWWQQHRLGRAAAAQEKAAYHQLISHSLSFAARASTLRNVMQTRSGLKEGVDVTFRLRRPFDPMELHDWLVKDFEPINDAWSKIQMIGTAASIDTATQLLDACADLIAIATTPGTAHGKVASTMKGIAFTAEQQEALQAATKHVTETREAFIKVTRKELGKEAVVLPLERAARPVPAKEEDRHHGAVTTATAPRSPIERLEAER